MADSDTDPHGICRGVMEGIRARLYRAVDQIESALDDLFDVLDDVDEE